MSQKEWNASLATCTQALQIANSQKNLSAKAHLIMTLSKIALFTNNQDSVNQVVLELDSLMEEGSSNPSSVDVALLKMCKLTTIVIDALNHGEHKKAVPFLLQLHSLSDTQATSKMDDRQFCDKKARKHVLLLAYLLSGVVHMPSDNYKAQVFMIEGLKLLEGNEVDVLQDDVDELSLVKMKALLLLYLSEVCMLRTEYKDSFEV